MYAGWSWGGLACLGHRQGGLQGKKVGNQCTKVYVHVHMGKLREGERESESMTKGPTPLAVAKLTRPLHRLEWLKSAHGKLKRKQQQCFTI